MNKVSVCLLPGLIACGVLFFTPRDSAAKPDYTKKERVQCQVCHDGGWSSGKYTDAGKYYTEHRTFKGYKQPATTGAAPAAPAKPVDGKDKSK